MLNWLKRLFGPGTPPQQSEPAVPPKPGDAYVVGRISDLVGHQHLVAADDPRRSLFGYHELRAEEEKQWDREEFRRVIGLEDPAKPDLLTLQIEQLRQAYSRQEMFDFVDVNPATGDSIVAELCREYRTGSAVVRAVIRSGIDFERAWTLLTFSKRAAIQAVRKSQANLIQDSLIAHAIENLAAGDVRDNLVVLGLVYHCARLICPSPATDFHEVAEMAGPAIAQLLMAFVSRPDLDGILGAMGWKETQTEQGVGYRWN